MRILLVIQKPQYRGAEVFAQRFAASLRRRGHEAQLMCLYSHDGPIPLPLRAEDIALEGREDHPLERWLTFQPTLLCAVSQAIRRADPEILQVHGGRTVKYGALASLRDSRRRWSLVYRNIGDPRVWLANPLRRIWYQRVVAPHLDGVVGVSRYTLEGVREAYDLDVPMIEIPAAVDPEGLQPTRTVEQIRHSLSTPREATVLISVGSLSPEKRPDRLVHAVARLDVTPPPYLWIVGAGRLRPTLETQARESGIDSRVRFLGVREDVGNLLHAADLFVLTSDTEGVPGVLLEAGYAGLPSVATRVGGVPECLLHETTGLLVESGNEEDLIRSLATLLRSPEHRRRLGRQAANHVREHFLLDDITDRYLAFYDRLRSTVQ